jgi:hypothetical protein
MEALASRSLFEAKTQTSRILVERAHPIRAELFDEERCVATISPQEAIERLNGEIGSTSWS